MNNLAPIVLFVYNRPQHTLQTLEALSKNHLAKESILYIYADGAKENANNKTLQAIEKTRAIIKREKWCKEVNIIEYELNKGLADSIVSGVTELVNKYGKVIVLEDDIVTSPGFLQYMNDALSLYEKEEKVMHISGFVPVTVGAEQLPETYFLRFMSCWGWATWKRSWDQIILDTDYIYNTVPKLKDSDSFNLEGAIDIFSQVHANYHGKLKTWAFKWYSTIFLKGGLCLYPRYSLVRNIGIDGSGENCSDDSETYQVSLAEKINVSRQRIKESKNGKKYLKLFYFYGSNPSMTDLLTFKLKNSLAAKLLRKIKYG